MNSTNTNGKVISLSGKIESEVVNMSSDAISALEKVGFKRWQKGGYDRLYISAAKLGLKIDKTGASFMGAPIDEKEGQRMRAARTYIDVHTGEVCSGNDLLEDAASKLISKVLTIEGDKLVI